MLRRGGTAFLAFGLLAAALVGCGRFSFDQREPWRLQAEESCLASRLVAPTAYMSQVGEIDGPGSCGITYPFRVSALAEGSVALTNRLTLACPIIPGLDAWLRGTVQPAAELYFGQPVSHVRAGSYSCRPRNNQAGAKVSEHAYGNAVDVMAFRLADGREIAVKSGWRGQPEEQDFLREVFVGACRVFTTVLGPGSDAFHYDHLHLDLARHDPAGRRHVCRPVLKFEPRLGAEGAATRPVPRPAPQIVPAEPGPPLEIDPDDDPYAVSRSGAPERRPSAQIPVASPIPRAPRPGEPLVLQPHLKATAGLY